MLRAGKVLPAAILLLAVGVARGQEKDKPQGEQWFKHLDSKGIADLEEKAQRIYAKVASSVVRIFPNPADPNGWFSGVIVTRSGEVFTCAHYDLLPQTKVAVELVDGSRVKGTTLGLVKESTRKTHYRAHDVGMIRLDEEREWPAAVLGRSADLYNGEFCLAIGHPYGHQAGQPPLLRVGRILPPLSYGQVRTSCRTAQGDSGGPLVDMEGRVLGVLSGQQSSKWAGSDYAAVEVFAVLRDRLRASEEIAAEKELPGRPIPTRRDAFGAFEPDEDVIKAAAAAHTSTVEILGDGRQVALGLVVGADGLILTKRSELAGCSALACRMADGRRLHGRVVSGSAEYDLALLKVNATSLPTAAWAGAGSLHLGQIVASLGPDPQPIHFGVIGAVGVSNPPVTGYLPISGKETTPKGLSGHVFTEVWNNRPDIGDLRERLRAGDLITHLDDLPTPTPEEYLKVRDRRLAAPDAMVGERVKLTVRRGEETLQVFVPIIPSGTLPAFKWSECPLSLRRNGFPKVFSHDGGVIPEQCGGPVVDRSGQVIGVNIARADEVQTFAIPADVVQKVVAELKSRAAKE
jgi:serine protease Do